MGDGVGSLEWATERDRVLAWQDSIVYGTVYAQCDDDGLLRRLNPADIRDDHGEPMYPRLPWDRDRA